MGGKCSTTAPSLRQKIAISPTPWDIPILNYLAVYFPLNALASGNLKPEEKALIREGEKAHFKP